MSQNKIFIQNNKTLLLHQYYEHNETKCRFCDNTATERFFYINYDLINSKSVSISFCDNCKAIVLQMLNGNKKDSITVGLLQPMTGSPKLHIPINLMEIK